jgi:hypothetical protein
MIEIFLKEYLKKNPAFPVGFDLLKLNKWFDILYREVENDSDLNKALGEIKSALTFQTIPLFVKFNHVKGYQQTLLKGPQFIHPDHISIIQKFETIKHFKVSNTEKLIENAITKGMLLEELFQFEVESYEASVISKLFLENTDRDIETQKVLLLKIKQFKNIKPRQSLFALSSFKVINILDESLPITNEKIDEIISEIDTKMYQSSIKNLEFKKKSFKSDFENKDKELGLYVGLPDNQLKNIYYELVENKYIHHDNIEEHFINAFNGQKLSNDYKAHEWISSVNLSIVVGLYASDTNKWVKCKYLFLKSNNLKSLFNTAQTAKDFIRKKTFLDSIFKYKF